MSSSSWQSNRFVSLRVKLLLSFTVVCGLVFTGLYCWFYNYASQKALERIEEDMVDTLKGAIAGVDGDEYEALAAADVPQGEDVPSQNPLYQAHQQWLREVNQIEPRANPYTVIKGDEPYEVLWVGDSLRFLQSENATAFRESYLADPAKTNLYKGFSGLTVTLSPYTDQWGSWISAYGPIKDDGGEVVGLLGVDFRADYVAQVRREIQATLAIAFGGTYLLLLALLALMSRIFTRPVIELTKATEQISAGDYDRVLSLFQQGTLPDEISLLASSFDRMTNQIQQREAALEEANTTLEHQVAQRTQELQEKNIALQQTLHDLQKTQTQLIQTEKMSSLGQLVAGIAHELNNPLNFIQCNLVHTQDYLEHLVDLLNLYQAHCPTPPPEIQAKSEEVSLVFLQADLPKMLSSMEVGTARIGKIIKSLRLFSRLDEAELKEVDLHDGIDSALMLLSHRLRGTSTRPDIHVVKHYGVIPRVECYAGQLNQVFMNILVNAIDALESEEDRPEASRLTLTPMHPEIQIRTECINDSFIAIHIRDNGPGMPESVRQHVFDPFFTTKEVGKGTGLGLSICHQIVTEKHNGKLHCISTPGLGSEFVIELPIRLSR